MAIEWDFAAVLGGMRVGDSFFIPCLACTDYRRQISRLAKQFGIKVHIRAWVQDYIRGLRIWRIE